MAADPAAALRAPAGVLAGELTGPGAAFAALEPAAAGADTAGDAAPVELHADRPAARASAATAVNVDIARGISMTSI